MAGLFYNASNRQGIYAGDFTIVFTGIKCSASNKAVKVSILAILRKRDDFFNECALNLINM